MAEVRWRKKAVDDLDRLDRWREEDLGLPPIGPAILRDRRDAPCEASQSAALDPMT